MIDAISTLAGVNVKAASVPAKSDVKRIDEQRISSASAGQSSVIEPPGRMTGQSAEALKSERRDQPKTEGISQVVESINSFLQDDKRALEFSVDEETGRIVISVMDADRKEVIRQIPSEMALKILAEMRDGSGTGGAGLSEKA